MVTITWYSNAEISFLLRSTCFTCNSMRFYSEILLQLKKLELKLKTFNDLEMMLSKECESVERARQKIYSEHARMVATRLGTTPAGSPNPPSLGAGTPGQRPAGYTPFGQAPQMHTPGSASSFQGVNPLGSAPSPGMQGLARPVTAGAMSTPQGQQFMRQGMVATPPQLVGRTAMPQQGITTTTTPSPQTLVGRSLVPPSANTPAAQTPAGRPLTAPPGMSRPAPGGTSGGGPQ